MALFQINGRQSCLQCGYLQQPSSRCIKCDIPWPASHTLQYVAANDAHKHAARAAKRVMQEGVDMSNNPAKNQVAFQPYPVIRAQGAVDAVQVRTSCVSVRKGL